MRTTLLAIVIGLLLVLLGAQLFLPAFMAARLGESLQAATGIRSLDVQLSSFPAVTLLVGNVERMGVSAADVVVDGLRIESIELEAENLRFDVGELWRSRQLEVRSGEAAVVRLTVTDAALTEYANARPELPPDVRVRISEEGVELTGSVTLLGNVVQAGVVGRFEPDGETGVVFVPEEVEVQGQALPPFLVAVLRETYRVHIDLTDGPFPVVVEDIVHMPGRLMLIGRPVLQNFGMVDATRPQTVDAALFFLPKAVVSPTLHRG